MRKHVIIAALLASWVFSQLNANTTDPAPFELCHGFIIVSAEYDGQVGDYIIDSGAPGLVLNSVRHDIRSDEQAGVTGVTGKSEASIVRDRDFVWRIVAIEDIEAVSIDLTYLEKALGREIAGLIGFDLFTGYDIIIDYDAHTIALTSDAWIHSYEPDFVRLPLTQHEHILSIEVTYEQRVMEFGIDTGSKSNLLDYCMSALINDKDCVELGPILLTGADQTDTRTKTLLIEGFKIGKYNVGPTAFVLADLAPFNEVHDLKLHGILGHPFFENSRLVIDKDRSHVYLSKSAIQALVSR